MSEEGVKVAWIAELIFEEAVTSRKDFTMQNCFVKKQNNMYDILV
jgi:hypothetical protein